MAAEEEFVSISTLAEAATAASGDERRNTDTTKKKKTPHPGLLIQQKRMTDEQALPQVLQFLKELIEQGNCRAKSSDNRVLPCQCLVQRFAGTPYESSTTLLPFAHYICDFSKLSRSANNLQLQNWILYAHGLADHSSSNSSSRSSSIRYILPQKHDSEGASPPLKLSDHPPVRVCQSALMHALNIGVQQWKSGTQAAATGNLFPVHGLKGRPSNAAIPAQQLESLHRVFQELLSTTTTTTNNNNHHDHPQLLLPPDITKRGVYRNYCKQNGGWIVKVDTNGTSSYVHSISGSTTTTLPNELVSWATFCKFWKTHYLHLETTNTSHISTNKSKKRRKTK